ncbi:MAG: lytic transglycosylase domain-containing protein [Patescibacteria group bacterium]|jgi:membrane-bound lytic murein transglycosylase B
MLTKALTAQNNFKQLIKRNWKKLSTFSLTLKFASVFALLAVIPGTPKITANTYNAADTNISLDTNSSSVLSEGSHQVQIISGTSNLDAQKAVKPQGQLASVSYSPAISRDGSYFQNIYKAAGAQFGVPWKLLQAVHYVESGCSDSGSKTSSAGAQGPMQFMPSTFRAYAVDGNGDGQINIDNVNDAIYTAAHYLAAGGAADGNISAALFNYNHSQSYVNKVLEVYNSIQG